MYFDFEDYRPDISPVGRAISWREGVLISIIVHLAMIIVLLLSPRLFPYDADAARAKLLTAQQQRLHQYVHDLGGSLILLGGERAFAAGNYSGSILEALSPLSSSPPPDPGGDTSWPAGSDWTNTTSAISSPVSSPTFFRSRNTTTR